MVTIGFIYPDHAAEDDYPAAQRLLGDVAELRVAHVYGTDLHAIPELRDLGSPARLAEGAEKLAPYAPAALVWACTSGSFVFGHQGAGEQVDQLAAASGVPASSTSFAFSRAARAAGIRRVAVAASYPGEVAELFVAFLAAEGIDVVRMASADIATAAEVGELTAESVTAMVSEVDHRDADAVLIPDTAMRTIGVIDRVEAELGKPILTANQVTIWEGLRLGGVAAEAPALGTLFARALPAG